MPTINSVVSQAQEVFGLSSKVFGGNRALANSSILTQSAEVGFSNLLRSEFGGQPALTNLVENYSNNKETFDAAMKENMASLKESSDKVKAASESENNAESAKVADTDSDNNTGAALSTLGEFANGNIPPAERNLALSIAARPKANTRPEPHEMQNNNLQKFANEYLTAEKPAKHSVNSNEDSRVTDVKNLVQNFNSTMSYLNENRGMSSRMAALADRFSESTKVSDSLNEVGISANSQGFLTVNETALNSAFKNNSGEVNSVLGSNGFAGQLEKNINLANYQGDKLFTSITDFANQQRQDDAESLYGNNAAYAKENTPRIFEMTT